MPEVWVSGVLSDHLSDTIMKCFMHTRWKYSVYHSRASFPPGKGVGTFLFFQKSTLREWIDLRMNAIALHLTYKYIAIFNEINQRIAGLFKS